MSRRLFITTWAIAALCAGCARAPSELVLSGPTQGTTYTIKIAGTPQEVDEDAVRRTIDEVLANIDREMSTYRADSAIAQFNAAQSTDWIDVPVGLARVVDAALKVSERTNGAFDITVAPLVAAWGFSTSGEPDTLPSDAQLAALRARIGHRRLEVRFEPAALRKLVPSLTVDVNGIAPGYAVDVLAERFKALGLRNFMIDIGGEVLVRGRNAADTPWRIAVERPEDNESETMASPFAIVELVDRSVTTSGEYRHYFERDGQRYSHTIDPRTGHPIVSRGSVAVVGRTSAEIDAWATALNVLGPEEGLRLANTEGIAAMYIVVDGDKLTARKSATFEREVRLIDGGTSQETE
jgi:thiamine biosynthesis lipoprotein